MKIIILLLLLISCFSRGQGIKNSVPINSIESNDFTDLQFLDTLLKGKRIIFLGESVHGIEDFNTLKFRLIRYLHQKQGFEVITFESGFSDCTTTNYVKDSLSGMEMLVRSLIGVWRVKGNCELMNYIREQHLALAGMDSNEGSLGLDQKGYNILLKDVSLAKQLFVADSLLLYRYRMPKNQFFYNNVIFDSHEMEMFVAVLKLKYQSVIKSIQALETMGALQKRVLIKGIGSKMLEISTSLNKKDDRYFVDGIERDKIMASNLEFIIDSMYRNKKVIVWAHNAHIGKKGVIDQNLSTTVHLPQRIKDQSFVIGLYALNGQHSMGMKASEPFTIKNNSFEDVYSDFRSKGIFISSQNMDHKKRFQGIWGVKGIVSELYDGVILLRDVKGSRLIRFNKEWKCE